MENRRDARAPFSGVFENKSPAVVQLDFLRFPSGALVETIWIGMAFVRLMLMWARRPRSLRVPGTIEPIEIGFFVGDPFLDRLPGWFDGFHRLDVEGRRRRAWELDDAFHSSLKLRMACPQAVEAQKKFDLLGALGGLPMIDCRNSINDLFVKKPVLLNIRIIFIPAELT